MKSFFIISILIFTLFSCDSNSGVLEDDPDTELIENFRISGTIKGALNMTLYLEAMSSNGTISVAECTTNDDGEFEMINNIPEMGLFQLRLGQEKENKIIPLPLVPNDNVTLTTSVDKFQINPVFFGTEWAIGLTKYLSLFNEFSTAVYKLNALQGKVDPKELMNKYYAARKPMENYCKESINQSPSNSLNIILTSVLSPDNGFENWDVNNLQALKKMSNAFSQKYKESPITKSMVFQVAQIEEKYKQYILLNSGTSVAPEIKLKNPEGIEIKLSSLRGKYVLIDFWASWCGPCRKENPNVVRLYNQYKDKGFTIFSVSLDKDISLWKQAILSDGLTWPNHVSDLSGWDTELINLYSFSSIPHTVLIDKEGKIIATGLRGESLEQKLKELIKN